MKLCLDEMYSPEIATRLRDRGHDVDSVKERPDLEGMADSDLLTRMTSEGRALLTENVADFAPLAQGLTTSGDTHAGLVFSSSQSMPRSRNTVGRFVDALDDVMRRHPRDEDFKDKIEWL